MRSRQTLSAIGCLLLTACGGTRPARPAAAPPDHAVAPAPAAGGVSQRGGTHAVIDEEVTVTAGTRVIHGTVSRPDAPGRHPGLMIIAGSGPTDRNWESPLLQGANGGGRQLGHALAERGIVVLRYDKLGTGQTPAPATPVSPEDYGAEQRAMLGHLRGHASVDPAHWFLAGHSEGGAHAIHLVAQLPADQRPTGLVLLASVGRTMRDVMVLQLQGNFDHAPMPPADRTRYMQQFTTAIDGVIAGRYRHPSTVTDLPPVQQLYAAVASPAGRPFSRWLLAYDPATEISALTLPMLIINGERDVQVSPTLDAQRLADAARHGGNTHVTLFLAPTANHVMKHETTPFAQLDLARVQAGYAAAGTVLDDDVVNTLATWLTTN